MSRASTKTPYTDSERGGSLAESTKSPSKKTASKKGSVKAGSSAAMTANSGSGTQKKENSISFAPGERKGNPLVYQKKSKLKKDKQIRDQDAKRNEEYEEKKKGGGSSSNQSAGWKDSRVTNLFKEETGDGYEPAYADYDDY